jgi:hypothetical protein
MSKCYCRATIISRAIDHALHAVDHCHHACQGNKKLLMLFFVYQSK